MAALAPADPSGQSSALSCDAMARPTPLVLSGVALDAPACSQPQACADPQAPERTYKLDIDSLPRRPVRRRPLARRRCARRSASRRRG